jgi:thymidine kinase
MMAKQKNGTIGTLFGTIEGITGPMASRKTSEFCGRVSSFRALEPKGIYKVMVAKPSFDNRPFSPEDDPGSEIISRYDKDNILAKIKGVYAVNNSGELSGLIEKTQSETKVRKFILAISEIQFFDSGIVDLVSHLGRDFFVLWEGLTLNFRGENFDFADFEKDMTSLVDITTKLESRDSHAICDVDGIRYAQFTQRLTPNGEPDPWYALLRQVGAKEYQARCADDHQVPYKKEAIHIRESLSAFHNSGLSISILMSIYHSLRTPLGAVENILATLEREHKAERTRHRLYIDRSRLEEEVAELTKNQTGDSAGRIEEINKTLKFWQDDVIHPTKYLRI